MQAVENATSASFELKADQFTLPNLRLLNTDMDKLADQLEEQVNRSPSFFLNTPVVIDLGLLTENNVDVDFALLVGLMRGQGMIPIGISGGSKKQQEMAELMELAILSGREKVVRPANDKNSAPVTEVAKRPVAVAKQSVSKLITAPIRSGQRVYAPGGDLIITSQVSSGAEVIADGNIHIYGALRGRALAGVKGDRNARIFCHNLQAELVAVAGQYLVNESIDEQQKNKPVQIFLTDKKLNIQAI